MIEIGGRLTLVQLNCFYLKYYFVTILKKNNFINQFIPDNNCLMIKRRIFIALIIPCLFCLHIESYSQMANIWYFGKNAGINFNSNTATALTDGQLDTREGSASICDKNGMILFYTNGVNVFDRNHQFMPNGSGLLGNASSVDAAIIIPKPGNANIYFIFSCDALENNHANGYRYSEVDMSLNGGNGAVTNKNILLYAPSTERLTAVKHANGIDYWIITKRFGNNNTFSAYIIDCNGVNPIPVNSNAGLTADAFGDLKASPNGKKIAMTLSAPRVGQVLDFDDTSGVLSNPIVLYRQANTSPQLYGIEFSPNGKLVYQTITNFTAFNIIYQYDISSSNETTVNLSRYVMYSGFGEINTGLKLAPDKKIYVNAVGSQALTVINNPDVYGVGCNLSSQSFQLNGRLCNYGLPSFVNSFLFEGKEIDFTKKVEECKVKFNGISTLPDNFPWYWDFGDGNFATGQSVFHIYSSVGTYGVKLKRIRFTICGTADTFYSKQNVIIDTVNFKMFAGNDTVVHTNQPFTLLATSNDVNVTYTWIPTIGLSNPFIANPVAILQNDITYHVTATNINGCKAVDDIFIKTFESDEIFMPSAFTPDNNGINDQIKPLGQGLKDVGLFEIYNRYGQLIFRADKTNKEWNGSFRGKPQPADTYVYRLEAFTYKGRAVKKTGSIVLIR